MQQGFAREVLSRLPLAEAGLILWRIISEANVLDNIFERNRGRCYEGELTFPVLVNLVADALLEHAGSGRKSFQRAQQTGELEVSLVSAGL